jgi:hypothetical protein
LGKYLVNRFLTCEVGTEKLYYDAQGETLFVPDANAAFRRIRARLHKIAVLVYSPEAVKNAISPMSPSVV